MKVDFVITWVDDTDEKWQEEKIKHTEASKSDAQRFRDWGLLKYWFRGVESFAPWVNNIYFITWGHIPEFLNVDHPKLKIINHKDYIDDQYLPTFNSNAIELSMHKIEGLSEHFVYFNDDMYLIKDTEVSDFFLDGKPRDVAIVNPIVPKYYNSIANIMLNNMAVLNSHFTYKDSFKGNFSKWINPKYRHLNLLNMVFKPWKHPLGLYQQHIPSSFLKNTFTELWEKEYDIMHQTSSRKLRNNYMDINQWLLKEWQVMSGNFEPRSIQFGDYIMINNIDDTKSIKKAIDNKRTKVICVNDHVIDDFDEISSETIKIFDNILSEKSQFEK